MDEDAAFCSKCGNNLKSSGALYSAVKEQLPHLFSAPIANNAAFAEKQTPNFEGNIAAQSPNIDRKITSPVDSGINLTVKNQADLASLPHDGDYDRDEEDDETWCCVHCTFINKATTTVCEMCDRTSWGIGNEKKKKEPPLDPPKVRSCILLLFFIDIVSKYFFL